MTVSAQDALEDDAPPVVRVRTLIVDDVPDLRRLIRIALERAGMFEVVDEAGDGAQGLELASRHDPELVILDVSMPVRDGMEILPELRAMCPNAKIVMLSGLEQARLGDMARALGADYYLEKGITPRQLVDVLLRVMDEPGPN